jgi:predicted Fe-Mo cluster-binding NifX family protein
VNKREVRFVKICVTSEGKTLDSPVDVHFGRCRYFLIVETDTMDYEVIENAHLGVSGGAGVQSGQLMSERNVAAVLTGNVGPNAFQTLNAAGVDMYTGVKGSVRAVLDLFISGQLHPVKAPTVNSKFGTAGG